MANDLELVHLAFNRVKDFSLKYGHSIPIFNEPDPVGSLQSNNTIFLPQTL
jgi:hypothetical protein